MGQLYHGYVSHNQRVSPFRSYDSNPRRKNGSLSVRSCSEIPAMSWTEFSFRTSHWCPNSLWLWLTVCHGYYDGPNRNRWFTVLNSMTIFHGKLLVITRWYILHLQTPIIWSSSISTNQMLTPHIWLAKTVVVTSNMIDTSKHLFEGCYNVNIPLDALQASSESMATRIALRAIALEDWDYWFK